MKTSIKKLFEYVALCAANGVTLNTGLLKEKAKNIAENLKLEGF